MPDKEALVAVFWLKEGKDDTREKYGDRALSLSFALRVYW
mgnify:FL=1